ncbi:MAG TPA: hypothetical protein VJ827_05365 [Rubrobacter sp.]|nr:hypothetical protein [Rubrobacter sp.]
MNALAFVACVPMVWVIFWAAVYVLSDPITWLLYAAGELVERKGWA